MKMIKKSFIPFLFTLIMLFSFAACNNGTSPSVNTFPNINNRDIPDALEKTVGTIGDTYFTSDISDNPEYHSFLAVTFEDTTEADYTTLMEHYQSTSTGTDESSNLLFDWGWLLIIPNEGTISINAYIL